MQPKLPFRPLSRRAFIGASGAALAAPALLRAQQKFTCRIAHSEAIGAPLTEAFEKWTQALRQRSNGQIDAQHFPASQLGGLAQLLEGSRLGTIQVTTAGPDSDEALAPEVAVFGGAPGFIYKDEAHVDRVLQGPLGEQVSQIAKRKTGVEFVAYGETGFRHVLSKRPVTSHETLKGLKIRVPELRVWVDFWRRLGANPTPLPYSEQYSALSTGVIDGLDSDVFSVLGFKWHEQAKHLTLTSHWFLPKAVRVNGRWLDGLPADLQELVRSSAKEVFAEQRTANRAKAAQALADIEKTGVTVHRIGEDERRKWAEATAPLFDEFGQKSPETKAMIERIRGLTQGVTAAVAPLQAAAEPRGGALGLDGCCASATARARVAGARRSRSVAGHHCRRAAAGVLPLRARRRAGLARGGGQVPLRLVRLPRRGDGHAARHAHRDRHAAALAARALAALARGVRAHGVGGGLGLPVRLRLAAHARGERSCRRRSNGRTPTCTWRCRWAALALVLKLLTPIAVAGDARAAAAVVAGGGGHAPSLLRMGGARLFGFPQSIALAGAAGDRPDAARRAGRRRAGVRHLRRLPAARPADDDLGAAGHGQRHGLPAGGDPVLHPRRGVHERRAASPTVWWRWRCRWSVTSAAASATSTCSPTR